MRNGKRIETEKGTKGIKGAYHDCFRKSTKEKEREVKVDKEG